MPVKKSLKIYWMYPVFKKKNNFSEIKYFIHNSLEWIRLNIYPLMTEDNAGRNMNMNLLLFSKRVWILNCYLQSVKRNQLLKSACRVSPLWYWDFHEKKRCMLKLSINRNCKIPPDIHGFGLVSFYNGISTSMSYLIQYYYYLTYSWVGIRKVKLATVFEGDQKALFSIATTPNFRGGHYCLTWIAELYPWFWPYIAEC